jgi:hypothetical protein
VTGQLLDTHVDIYSTNSTCVSTILKGKTAGKIQIAVGSALAVHRRGGKAK